MSVLTKAERVLLKYLKEQEVLAEVTGVTMREMSEDLHLGYLSFKCAVKGLEDKGYIKYTPQSTSDKKSTARYNLLPKSFE